MIDEKDKHIELTNEEIMIKIWAETEVLLKSLGSVFYFLNTFLQITVYC